MTDSTPATAARPTWWRMRCKSCGESDPFRTEAEAREWAAIHQACDPWEEQHEMDVTSRG